MRRGPRARFVLLFLCFLAAHLPARAIGAPALEFELVSLDEGVSHNLVYTLHQDATGFLWLGTLYGLVRFDGQEYRTFRHDPRDTTSLANDDVVCICEVEGGDLWIGTYGGGVNRYDRGAGKFERFLPSGAEGRRLSDDIVWDVEPDAFGNVWVATARALDRIDPEGRVTSFRHAPDDEMSLAPGAPRTLARDGEGGLWVVTSGGGLDSIDVARGRFRHHTDAAATFAGRQFSALRFDTAGAMWVGSLDAGLGWRPPGSAHIEPVGKATGFTDDISASVQALATDPDGVIWVGSGRGLHLVSPSTREVALYEFRPDTPGTLRPGPVVTLLRDRSGVLWVGSYQSGLSRALLGGRQFSPAGRDVTGPRSALYRNVLSICEDRSGTLWTGTGPGLVARDARGRVRTYAADRENPRALPGFLSRALALDASGTLWIGTAGGLCRYDAARDAFTRWPLEGDRALASPTVEVLHASREGLLWVGTGGGLHRLDPDAGTVERFLPVEGDSTTLPDASVLSLYEDRRGRLWVSTFRGLSRRDPSTGAFRHFRNDPYSAASLGNNYVYAYHEAADGSLWLGTGGGLDRFDESSETFQHFRETDGLPNGVVGSILAEGGGALWLGTHRGLVRFDPVSHRVTSYDLNDGLQGNLFHPRSAARLRDGTFVFGGPGGFNSFRPEAISAQGTPPAVALTKVVIAGRRSSPWADASRLTQLRLPSRESFFSFEFAGLDFRRPSGLRYSYRMDGLEPDWIEAGSRRVATYTSVPPGRYRFRVRATNAEGVPGAETTIGVTIDPPLWRTPAFFGAAATLALALGLGTHAARVRRGVRQAIALERAREEERESVRRRAAADFHDELGHRLARIGLFADLLERGATDGADMRSYLARIAAEARRLADESRDFFWSLGAERGNVGELLARLERFGQDLFERTGVDFRIESRTDAIDAIVLAGDARRNLASIFKEAMTNALRHAACRHVVLRVAAHGDELTLTLEDDGRGFPQATASVGQGFKNMELRARKVGGTISIASEPGAGTRIAFTRRAIRAPFA